MDSSNNYKSQLKPFLKELEGFSKDVYKDSRGFDTVGYGFNLDAPETAGYLAANGYDANKIREQGMSEEDADRIKDFIIDKEEEKLRKRIPESFDTLSENEKAAVMSLHYNSPKLIGPSLQGYLASGDKLNAAKEIATRSNKNKELGVAFRRLKEAEMFNSNLGDVFKIMSPEEKYELQQIINNSDNENVKRDITERYGSFLGLKPTPIKFTKLR